MSDESRTDAEAEAEKILKRVANAWRRDGEEEPAPLPDVEPDEDDSADRDARADGWVSAAARNETLTRTRAALARNARKVSRRDG